MSEKSILVFGKTGQLAQCLADAVPSHIRAIFLSRNDADFEESPDFSALLSAHEPSLVVNATAYTAVDQAEDEEDRAVAVNATAVEALVQACGVVNKPFFHISTDYVFAGNKPLDESYLETDPTRPLGAYGRSKLGGENAILKANCNGFKGYIFRTAWVYSIYGNNFLKTMLRLGAACDKLGIVADQYGSPTSAHEIAKTLWLAVDKVLQDDAPPAGIFHLSNHGKCSWYDFALMIFEHAASKGYHTPNTLDAITSDAFPTKVKRPSNSWLNCDKFCNQFGLRLPPWQQSIPFVVDHLSKENWVPPLTSPKHLTVSKG